MNNNENRLNEGDKVRTIYGRIETVMYADDARVITYESSARLSWYHPTKVWK